MSEYLIVGRIRKPHGIHGEVIVDMSCDAPGELFAPGRRVIVGDDNDEPTLNPERALEVIRSRPFKNAWLIGFAGIPDRNESERWRLRALFAPVADLAPPTEGEFWVHELVGMQVRDASGADVGTVASIATVPQGFLLDVRAGARTISVPFVEEIVTGIDRDARVVIIDPPDGLMDL